MRLVIMAHPGDGSLFFQAIATWLKILSIAGRNQGQDAALARKIHSAHQLRSMLAYILLILCVRHLPADHGLLAYLTKMVIAHAAFFGNDAVTGVSGRGWYWQLRLRLQLWLRLVVQSFAPPVEKNRLRSEGIVTSASHTLKAEKGCLVPARRRFSASPRMAVEYFLYIVLRARWFMLKRCKRPSLCKQFKFIPALFFVYEFQCTDTFRCYSNKAKPRMG